MRPSLSEALLSGAPPTAREALRRLPALDDLVRSSLTAAHGAWTPLVDDDRDFLRHLGSHLPDGSDAPAALLAIEVEDLYLAWACSRRAPAALALFDKHFLAPAGSAVGRLGPDRALTDEVKQELRQKLFLGERPKILDYSGRGSLLGWLRAVAVRTALNQKRGKAASAPRADPDEALALPTLAKDPEVALIHGRYREVFRAAFSDALGALSSRERNMLRLHSLDGLSIDEIGRLLKVHRATAARWIIKAREFLLEDTRRRLSERLHLEAREADSLMGALHSQLDVSIHRLLADKKERDGQSKPI